MTSLTSVTVSVPLTIRRRGGRKQIIGPDGAVARQGECGAGVVPVNGDPALIKALRSQGANDIVVFVGGVIPAQDYDQLYKDGAAGIFGPGTPIPQCAHEVLRAIRAAHLPASA